MTISNRRNAIQSHFAKRGVKFAIKETSLIQQLEKLLGKERFVLWDEVNEKRSVGQAAIGEEYKIFQTVQEMNLLSSSQAEATLEIAVWISSMLDNSLEPKMKLVDLGCSVGNLTSWVAEIWPETQIVGVDVCENFIHAANRDNEVTNLSYRVWDYGLSAFSESRTVDVLICSLGIDFPQWSFRKDLDSRNSRETVEYETFFEESKKYFSNWRTAIIDSGRLFAVLRIPSFSAFTALVDAASICGWSLDLSFSTKIRARGEQFPALVFTALPSERFSELELASFWCQRQISELFLGYLNEPLAGVVYRSMSDRHELKRVEKTYPDGNVARTVIGTAGPLGYRFMNTTLGIEALQMVPVVEVGSLKPTFDWYLLLDRQQEGQAVENRKKK